MSISESKYYLTKQGLEKIKKEHQSLLKFEKKKTTGDEVPSLLHSEEVNPDYLAFQEDMSLLEARLLEYDTILRDVEIISSPPKAKRNEVHVGAKVLVEVDGEKDEFVIVGSLEANPAAGMISNESPVGKVLLGSKVGDVVVVNSSVVVSYKILEIVYN